MIKELDTVVLKRDLVEHGLEQGDVGTVVHRYRTGEVLEVEFVTGKGETVAVLTLDAEDVRPVHDEEAFATMQHEYFALRTREEVKRFEKLTEAYLKRRTQFSLQHVSLVQAFDFFQEHPDGGRAFAALLDIHINFMLLYCDTHEVGATWNGLFSKGKLEGGSVLDSETKFFGRMDIHRYNSSFILRYRALWDKVMGFLILLFDPCNYENFVKAKSRRKKFRSIAKNIPQITDDFIDHVDENLEKFNNVFRTPEAHGTGTLRKWSFTMESMDKNPSLELIGYWNMLNSVMSTIGEWFDKSKE